MMTKPFTALPSNSAPVPGSYGLKHGNGCRLSSDEIPDRIPEGRACPIVKPHSQEKEPVHKTGQIPERRWPLRPSKTETKP